jgi:hypothetical protein
MYVNLKDNPKNRAFLRKNSVRVPDERNPIIKKNTFGLRKGSNSPSGGIKTIKDLDLNYGEKLDDSHISSVMNPTHAQYESAQYISLKTTEKLIINQL